MWADHGSRQDQCIPARCQQHNAGCDVEAILQKAPDGCVLIGGHTRNFINVLQRSVFCAVVPGNGWAHIEEPVIQGCIPVVIMPGIHVQLEGVLDLSKFGIRIARSDIPKIVDILRAIPAAKVKQMQAEVTPAKSESAQPTGRVAEPDVAVVGTGSMLSCHSLMQHLSRV